VVRPEDIPDLIRLNALCGFPERSAEGWDWILFQNPLQGEALSGFVYETDKGIVSFIGGIIVQILKQDAKLDLTNGHTLVSDLNNIGSGYRILKFSLKNHDGDFTYTLNNNALVPPVYRKTGVFVPLETEAAPYYLRKILSTTRMSGAALLRKLDRMVPVVRSLIDREWYLKQLKTPQQVSVPSPLELLDPAAAEHAAWLDQYNQDQLEDGRWHARRDSIVWKFRCDEPDSGSLRGLYGLREGNRLIGLICVSLIKETHLNASALEIEDLVVLTGQEEHISTLMEAIEQVALDCKVASIFWRVLPEQHWQTAAQKLNWTVCQRDYCSRHIEPHETFDPSEWAAGAFESDLWFAQRRPPKHLFEDA